jgi:16S rRNA (uracil1498-N3)-methyltransferase
MSEQPPAARLHVEQPLGAGAGIPLDADRAHYLRNVLRLEPGASVALFNGRDGEWLGHIDALDKRGATVTLRRQTRVQAAEPDLWLCFAPIKKARIDFVAEKATELGVSALQPVFTRHTAMTRVNLERLRANAVEAAEQTERLSVPAVHEPVALDDLLQTWPSGRRLLLADEAGGGRPLAATLGGLDQAARCAPWAVLVGPEGGFARAELDALRKLPFVTAVGLGPRILRADTAALAALACWQALLGDWQLPTPHLSGDYRHR